MEHLEFSFLKLGLAVEQSAVKIIKTNNLLSSVAQLQNHS